MTGNCDIPFAQPEMVADEGISSKADKNYGLKHLDGKIFRIHTICGTFSEEGYSQRVEFETNAHFEDTSDQAKLRIAPQPNTNAPGNKPTGYSTVFPARD